MGAIKSMKSLKAMKLTSARAHSILAKFKKKKIVVFGDVGLDQYTVGKVHRISPEAPIPIVEVTGVSYKLGLAANVADNVATLGGVPLLIGLVGRDHTARFFERQLGLRKISSRYLVQDSRRPTTLKERVVAESQQVVRIDHETKSPIQGGVYQKVESQLEAVIESADCVIIEDYAKGLVTSPLCQFALQMASRHKIPVLVDPNSRTPLKVYRGCTLMTPNTLEAEALTGITIDSLQKLKQAGQILLEELGSPFVIITRGKDGMALFARGHKDPWLMPTFAREVYDVSGAGDTVIATLALAIVSGATLTEAALLANYAAGVEVGKRGTATVTPQELLDYMKEVSSRQKHL